MKFTSKIALNTIATSFFLLCIFFSFITYTIDVNEVFFLKFLTVSEVFGIIALFFFFLRNFQEGILKTKVSVVYKASLFLIASFSLGLICTKDFKSTLVAILTLIYLLALSFSIYETFKTKVFFLIESIIVTFLVMSVLGFYDYFALKNNLPTIFPNLSNQYIISGFRYFGQTGDYTFMILTFLLPFQFSNLSLSLSKKWFLTLRFSTFLGTLVLLGTGRVSSILSIAIGLFLWLLFTRNLLVVKKFVPEILLLFLVLFSSPYAFTDIYNNVTKRYESRISHRVANSLEAEFVVDNFTFAIDSFKKKPVLGYGLASITNPTNGLEIHGTYLKILAETGLLGMVFYILFMFSIVKLVITNFRKGNSAGKDFFFNYFPFLISSLVMWSYEYHLRKKEFWIILAVILIIAQKDNQELKAT